MAECCGNCECPDPEHQPAASTVFYALHEPGHPVELWDARRRLFLPLNFMIGWTPTDHTAVSAEFGIPIIKDFPVYAFKTQLRIGYLF